MAKKTTLGFSDPNAASDKFEMVSVKKLRPRENHPFKLYVGEKLERMVQSIKDNGVMQPIIVRPIEGNDDEYEIISGHNRTRAAELAGKTEVPAVIRNLSDDEAIRSVNESNIVQRSLENWLPSEMAKSISQHYESIKRQGKRPTGDTPGTSGELNQKWDARKETAKVYGIGENGVRTYLSLNNLIDPLLDRLDDKQFGITPAKNLSHIPSKVQEYINSILDEDGNEDGDPYGITLTNSKKLKSSFGKGSEDFMDENKAKEKIRNILTHKNSETKKIVAPDISETFVSGDKVTLIFPTETYTRLFQDETDYNRIVEKIARAIEFYDNHNPTQNPKTA